MLLDLPFGPPVGLTQRHLGLAMLVDLAFETAVGLAQARLATATLALDTHGVVALPAAGSGEEYGGDQGRRQGADVLQPEEAPRGSDRRHRPRRGGDRDRDAAELPPGTPRHERRRDHRHAEQDEDWGRGVAGEHTL